MKILKIIKYYFIKFINIITFKPTYSLSQKQLFKKLKKFDIVLANMPLNYLKLLDIPSNHHIRPFVIYKKSFSKLYVYYVSSKDHGKNIKLNKKHYHLDKDSYLYLNRTYILKKQHLIKYIDHLKKEDIKKL